MELITLCGLVIVVFGLWVEFTLTTKAVVKMIRSSRLVRVESASTVGQHADYMSRLPVCLTKLPPYRHGV